MNESMTELVSTLLLKQRKIQITPREKCILEALFGGHTYQHVGTEYGYSEGTLQNAASKLFKDFSVIFEREVNRRNCKEVLNEIASIVGNHVPSRIEEQASINIELWMHENRCKIIAVDPAKNQHSKKILQSFFHTYYSHFDYAVWLDLRLFSSLRCFLTELIIMIGPAADLTYFDADRLLDLLLERMHHQQCLIIVDCNEHAMSTNGGSFDQLFGKIAHSPHSSLFVSNYDWQYSKLGSQENHLHRLSVKTTDAEYLENIGNLAFIGQ